MRLHIKPVLQPSNLTLLVHPVIGKIKTGMIMYGPKIQNLELGLTIL